MKLKLYKKTFRTPSTAFKHPSVQAIFCSIILSGIFLLSQGINAQSVFWAEDFETDGHGVTYLSPAEFYDGSAGTIHDYTGRVDTALNFYLNGAPTPKIIGLEGSTGSGGKYLGASGAFYMACEDNDDLIASGGMGNADGNALNTVTLPATGTINIAGYTNLTFKGLFAAGSERACPDNDYDIPDTLRVLYSVDGQPDQRGLCFSRSNKCAGFTDFNEPLALDTNCDGNGDGSDLTNTFMEFSFAIPSGNTLTLKVLASSNSGDEEMAFDNLRLEGIAPNLMCNNITVYLDNTGNYSLTPADSMAIVSGTSGVSNITFTPSLDALTCADIGDITVTVSDDAMNAASCMATITVADTLAPNLDCSNQVIVYLDANGMYQLSSADSTVLVGTTMDNCGDIVVTFSRDTFTCSDVPPPPPVSSRGLCPGPSIWMKATDATGNADSCLVCVNVMDTMPPMVVCQDISVYLDASGQATITASDVDGGSMDACTGVSLSVDMTTFSCSDVTAAGAGGAMLLDPDMEDWAAWTTTTTSTGSTTASSGCSTSGTTIFQYGCTAGYDGGATFPAFFDDEQYVIDDDNAGSGVNGIHCIVSPVLDLSPGGNMFAFDWEHRNSGSSVTTAEVYDGISWTNVFTSASVNGTGQQSGIDLSGYSNTDFQVRLCYDDAGTFGWGSAFDNVMVSVNGPHTGPVATLTAQDFYGNESTCTANITVIDTIAPTCMTMNDTVYLDAAGMAPSIDSNSLDNGSMDACGIASITLSQTDFTCADVGDAMVTQTVTDVNGNSSTCMAVVTVLDTIAPVCMVVTDTTLYLDMNGMASLNSNSLDNGSSDNCPLVGFALDASNFGCDDVGTPVMVTQTVYELISGTTGLIPSDGTGGSLTVPDTFTANVSGVGTIADLNVVINFNHTFLGDVEIDLVSPAGTIVQLMYDDCGGSDDFMATFDDAGSPIVCASPVVGLIAPDSALAKVNGEDPNGTWKLLIRDDAGGDSGELLSWGLDFGVPTGNSSTCTSIVTVLDTLAPVLECGNQVNVYLDASGMYTLTPADSAALVGTTSDNCGGFTVSFSRDTFTCADAPPPPTAALRGSIGVLITMKATDANGNADSCDVFVNVLDTLPPMAVCQNIDVYLDAAGMASIVAADVDGGSMSSCGSVSLSIDVMDFTCANVGAQPGTAVTLTVMDDNNRTSTCAATVTVLDTIAPTCVMRDTTLYLDASGMATIDSNSLDDGSSDNCGIMSITLSQTDFTCSDVGTIMLTQTVTDSSGNASQCAMPVSILDTLAPMLHCGIQVTVYLDANGMYTLSAVDSAALVGSTSDNCGGLVVSFSRDTFTCADVPQFPPTAVRGGPPPISIVMKATDASGNADSCDVYVYVFDTLPPTAVCQNIDVYLDAAGMASITAADVDGGSMANCGGPVTLSIDIMDFTCADEGVPGGAAELLLDPDNENWAAWTPTTTSSGSTIPSSGCSTSGTTIFQYGCTAGYAGGATFPAFFDDVQYVIDDDNAGSGVNGIHCIVSPVLNLSSGGVELAFDWEHRNAGSSVTTAEIYDGTSWTNVFTSASVTGTGQQSGIDLSAYTNTDFQVRLCHDDAGTYGWGSAFDNVKVTASSPSGGAVVTLTVMDDNGRTSTCSANVSVLDTIAPTCAMHDTTLYLDGSGMASLDSNGLDDGSSDICGITTIDLSQKMFTCADVGMVMVTQSVTDANGNVSTCVMPVIVLDTISPVCAIVSDTTFYLDANGEVNLATNALDNGSSDNCSITGFTLSQSMFTCADIGAPIMVTQTIYDGYDPAPAVNFADTGGPIPSIGTGGSGSPADTFDVAVSGLANVQDLNLNLDLMHTYVSDLDIILQSPSGTVITIISGACGSGDDVLATFDDQGDVGSCTGTTPVISGTFMAFEAFTSFTGESANGTWKLIIKDNYGGDFGAVNAWSLDFSNFGGNSTMCSSMVTILDTLAPIAACADITVSPDASGMYTLTAADSAALVGGTSENCGSFTTTISQTMFSCADTVEMVTLTFTDQYNNMSTCMASVTVLDNIIPIISCDNVNVTLDAAGTFQLPATFLVSNKLDNCTSESNLKVSFSGTNPDSTMATIDCSYVVPSGSFVPVPVWVFDEAGNAAMCEGGVRADDLTPPTVVCNDVTIDLMTSNAIAISGSDSAAIIAGTMDNCASELTVTFSPATLTCSQSGTIVPVLVTVSDADGNSGTCTSMVSVEGDMSGIVYVNQAVAGGSNDGSDWTNAFSSLNSALASMGGSCGLTMEIWVAAGTYSPTDSAGMTPSDPSHNAFVMLPGVGIYGGFVGTETMRSERDYAANETILDGGTTAAHVVTNNMNGLDATAILDGFTVTGGNATGVPFNDKFGGGMYNNESSPTVNHCKFHNNSAIYGGGILNKVSDARILNSMFIQNIAHQGGGIFNWKGSTSEIVNCVFSQNVVSKDGAAMYNNKNCIIDIINCSMSGNSCGRWGGAMMTAKSSTAAITNSILWGNARNELRGDALIAYTVNYTDISGGYPGTSNINMDPLFVSAGTNDLRLMPSSPALEAGDDMAVPVDIMEDIDGNNRFQGASVDMGAYEGFVGPLRPANAIADEFDAKLTPNPASDFLHVELSGIVGPIDWEIRDMQGSLIKRGLSASPQFQIDLSTLPSLQYLIFFKSQDEVVAKQITKVRS